MKDAEVFMPIKCPECGERMAGVAFWSRWLRMRFCREIVFA